MKKAYICIILVVAALIITACSAATSSSEKPSPFFSRFQSYYAEEGTVIVDNETGVCYLCRNNSGLTVMVEPDGSPLIYREAAP